VSKSLVEGRRKSGKRRKGRREQREKKSEEDAPTSTSFPLGHFTLNQLHLGLFSRSETLPVGARSQANSKKQVMTFLILTPVY